jgi:2-aminoadipate transaminase
MAAFLSNGASLVGIPLDSDGVNIEKLEERLLDLRKAGKKIKFFYTIPNFQNPSGATPSQEKRKKLYELSIKHNLIILEDDPYGELYFEGKDEDYLSIKSIGNEAAITYIGTFSKILCPGFRIGYILSNKTVVEKLELAKQSNDACSSSFGQVVASEYLNRNLVENYIKKMRVIYKEKCDTMLSSIKESFPNNITYSKPKGGFFIYVNLGEKISANGLFANVIKRNVAFVTGDPFHTDEKLGDSHIRLSFSSSSKEQIVSGIKIIGEEILKFYV